MKEMIAIATIALTLATFSHFNTNEQTEKRLLEAENARLKLELLKMEGYKDGVKDSQ